MGLFRRTPAPRPGREPSDAEIDRVARAYKAGDPEPNERLLADLGD